MCFDLQLQFELNQKIAQLNLDADVEIDNARATGDMTAFSAIRQEIRDVNKQLENIPHKFEVGDECSTGGNGDAYPYRVKAVSASGKTITIRAMNWRVVAPADGSTPQVGHQSFEVFDHGPDEEVDEMVATLRSNGRWVIKGRKQDTGYGGVYPGASYRRNWEL